MPSPANNDNSMELPVKEEPVRVKEKDNKDKKNESRPKPTHKKRPRGRKQATVDTENAKPTETNKTKSSAKRPDDSSAHGPIRASSKMFLETSKKSPRQT
ncbi:hypothetical protein SI65_10047 [Aspergillus cristatus]|uniref:Uncharacterized protein n=1 Tax=Aspergillus cristatus TaxID=573508 RepID=A0A1E3B141_ASPCR|nr:hypothetical protein SI65_10047 [Aspergillus cristatus]